MAFYPSTVHHRTSRGNVSQGTEIHPGMLFFPFFCALLIGFGVGEAHARPDGPEIQNYSFLTLEISDVAGTPLEARVRIRGCDGRLCPDVPDSVHLSYWGGRGYSYADGSITVRVPRGTTGLTIGRGFEWAPYNGFLSVESDTAITIVLERFTDLREEGWFAGEIHAHSQHPPIDYVITPEISLRIARAEGLSVLHLLDQNYEFTGAPHPISDEETILHYSWEYRNQTYGHVSLPGLRESVGWGCCSVGPPESGGSGNGSNARAGPPAHDRRLLLR